MDVIGIGSTPVFNYQKVSHIPSAVRRYVTWAYVEAANFAVRYCPQIKRDYQRKRAKTNGIAAIKTVAHKLARACYHILVEQAPFDVDKTLG